MGANLSQSTNEIISKTVTKAITNSSTVTTNENKSQTGTDQINDVYAGRDLNGSVNQSNSATIDISRILNNSASIQETVKADLTSELKQRLTSLTDQDVSGLGTNLSTFKSQVESLIDAEIATIIATTVTNTVNQIDKNFQGNSAGADRDVNGDQNQSNNLGLTIYVQNFNDLFVAKLVENKIITISEQETSVVLKQKSAFLSMGFFIAVGCVFIVALLAFVTWKVFFSKKGQQTSVPDAQPYDSSDPYVPDYETFPYNNDSTYGVPYPSGSLPYYETSSYKKNPGGGGTSVGGGWGDGIAKIASSIITGNP
jgi:hypothetical protein